eukprot:7468599-Pyramimonas_sp.AAC.3
MPQSTERARGGRSGGKVGSLETGVNASGGQSVRPGNAGVHRPGLSAQDFAGYVVGSLVGARLTWSCIDPGQQIPDSHPGRGLLKGTRPGGASLPPGGASCAAAHILRRPWRGERVTHSALAPETSSSS